MLQIIFISILSALHPFYVSMTEIKHNAKDKRIEVSCRIFFDDLEHTLEKKYNVQIDILKPADRKKVDLIIADYIKKHLNIKTDGKVLTLTYLGYQIEEDACWCYFEVSNIPKVSRMEVFNDLLFAEHSSQINMLQATINGKEKTTKLDNPQSTAVFTF
jgi:hypothetical protein